jgi:DNA-directed RNA polymerase specialized sigma24 family protein
MTGRLLEIDTAVRHRSVFQNAASSPGPWNPLVEGLAALSEELRRTILLRDVEGLSPEAIAALLDCPLATVKSRINLARLQLYRILRQSDPEWLSAAVRIPLSP